jgi:hypothetical protein
MNPRMIDYGKGSTTNMREVMKVAEDIRLFGGVILPLKVCRKYNGRLEVLDGVKRLAAIHLLGSNDVDVVLVPRPVEGSPVGDLDEWATEVDIPVEHAVIRAEIARLEEKLWL